jgi:hypothetical protein
MHFESVSMLCLRIICIRSFGFSFQTENQMEILRHVPDVCLYFKQEVTFSNVYYLTSVEDEVAPVSFPPLKLVRPPCCITDCKELENMRLDWPIMSQCPY